jgi:hypothetical protein
MTLSYRESFDEPLRRHRVGINGADSPGMPALCGPVPIDDDPAFILGKIWVVYGPYLLGFIGFRPTIDGSLAHTSANSLLHEFHIKS